MTTPTPDASLPQTPRTDALSAECAKWGFKPNHTWSYAKCLELARSLERQSATLKAERDHWKAQAERANKTLAELLK